MARVRGLVHSEFLQPSDCVLARRPVIEANGVIEWSISYGKRAFAITLVPNTSPTFFPPSSDQYKYQTL